VLNALVNMPDSAKAAIDHPVQAMVAGAAPPAKVIGAVEEMGIKVTHTYGLTEVYGPVTVCAWHEEWDALTLDERARIKSRQGVRYPTLDGLMVADPQTLEPVPRDGNTLGEIFMRGNTVMKGYLKNPEATAEAFRGGWFHTGDLAVWHADGYVEIKDRLKDIIISGGENISTIEVEDALYRHPAVLEAAVVARPTKNGARRPAPSSPSRPATAAPAKPKSSPGAASTWPGSRCRRPWCSASCPRPAPARSRSTYCATAPGALKPSNLGLLRSRTGKGAQRPQRS
jgi:fatty-acyl-CoA synthase